MTVILPPPTSVGNEVGRSLGQGVAQGGEQAFQRNQIQSALKQLENLPPGASAFDRTKQLLSVFAGIPGSEKQIAALLPYILNQAQYGEGQGQLPQGGVFQGETAQSGQAPQQERSIFHTRTPQEIEAESLRFARAGGDYGKRQGELQASHNLALSNQKTLYELAEKSGISPTRMPELYNFALSRPDLRSPAEVVSAAKKEFGKLDKFKIPGFWSKVLGGPSREQSTKSLHDFYKTMSDLGREQEARTSMAEKGLTQTEISYAAHPLSETPQVEKALKELPDGSLKPKSLKEVIESEKERFGRKEFSGDFVKQRAETDRKELEDLTDFFDKNLNEDSSLLVLRDQLFRKGYDWRRINEAFSNAVPNPAKNLTQDQISELGEMAQAPIPSLRDIWLTSRLGKFLQGAR